MTDAQLSKGDEPAIRKAVVAYNTIESYPCPFCGDMALLLNGNDLGIDTKRVEVFCGNSHCEARDIVILIKRGAGAHRRADVWALRAVDEGTDAEQEVDGAILERDAEGNVASRAWSCNKASRSRSRGERDHQTLERRRRPTNVTVGPIEQDDEKD
jgi:hypothetical protein